MSESVRTAIFMETKDMEPPPEGFSDLTIRASIKTHSGEHAVWWIKDIHGKSGYPFIINIDGQAVTWQVEGYDEDESKPGEKDRSNPEAGSGRKYVLEKRVRLREGAHTVSFGLSAENYFTQVEIETMQETQTILEFKPVYRKRSRAATRSFLLGIERYKALVNGM